jgi:uncharacterized phage protein (TIGR02218 family)
MRPITPALAERLASGVTTTCRCWKAVRRDGAIFGFTDHDRDVTFGTLTYAALSGLDAAESASALGLSSPAQEVRGALTASAITEEDIASGLWDGASIETWLVDWKDPAERLLLEVGTIGEVTRASGRFVAEIRSAAQVLDQERGRRYTALCDAELGDARCGASLGVPGRRFALSVASAPDRTTLRVATPWLASAGAFAGGMVAFQTGANAGRSLPVQAHRRLSGGEDEIALWTPAPFDVAPTTLIEVTVGCDKSFATCRDRFFNWENFRGFPHIPGNDHLIRHARTGDPAQDGGVVRP